MHDGSLRIGWISPRADADDLGLISGLAADQRQLFPWTPSRFAFGNDQDVIQALHAASPSFDGFVVSGLSLTGIESLFNLRAMQVLERRARFDAPSIIIVPPNTPSDCFHRLGDRVRSAWPFRSALFIGDAATVERLRSEGLAALARTEAAGLGLSALLERREGTFESMLADQMLAVHIQPAWPYGGSHTVFSNQIDALLDRGWFVLRIIVDPECGPGPSMRRRMIGTVADANVDATPHIDTLACTAGAPETIEDENAYELQRHSLRNTMRLVIPDDLMSRMVARADIAVVNYVLHLGFALKACPAARLVLETHDDVTSMRLTQWREFGHPAAFPDFATLSRHVRLERLAWRLADVCIALSLSDLAKIRRHTSQFVFVLPRPYVRTAARAGHDARWDILIIMNPHHFNIPALDRFLSDVIAGDPRLSTLRIAVAGRVNEVLEPAWKDRLPATAWLGYVGDVDALRDSARISVCPDLHGTGIAIKTLTAIAAGHPLIATRTALRGLPDEILRLIPPADSAADMRDQILDLLNDDTLLEQRRDDVSTAAALLWPATSHARALSLAMESVADRSQLRADFLACLDQAPATAASVDSVDRRIRFGAGGNDRRYLGRNWLHDEPGGRWTDGASATIQLPRAWLASTCRLELTFMETFHCREIALKYRGKPIEGEIRSSGRMSFDLDLGDAAGSDRVELEIACAHAFCPKDAGINDDERVLGAHVRTIQITSLSRLRALAARARRALVHRVRTLRARARTAPRGKHDIDAAPSKAHASIDQPQSPPMN
ncbi:glycosyltransferase [Bradyrhizobium sp.]|uniref:glycosyltransferase n=1 Tax=Bradyrhizobium sp. TaxID=376 RepID=UPI0039E3D91E